MRLKAAYERKLQAQVDECSAEIDRIKAAQALAGADAKFALEQQLKDLEAQFDATQRKLHELKEADENAWEDVKAGIDIAWDSMAAALKRASHRNNG